MSTKLQVLPAHQESRGTSGWWSGAGWCWAGSHGSCHPSSGPWDCPDPEPVSKPAPGTHRPSGHTAPRPATPSRQNSRAGPRPQPSAAAAHRRSAAASGRHASAAQAARQATPASARMVGAGRTGRGMRRAGSCARLPGPTGASPGARRGWRAAAAGVSPVVMAAGGRGAGMAAGWAKWAVGDRRVVACGQRGP